VILDTPLRWLAVFTPLGLVLFLSFRIERMTAASAGKGHFYQGSSTEKIPPPL
jgi:FtsH-binding integral membrane protein